MPCFSVTVTADQPAVKKTVKRRYNKKLVITNFTVSVQHMTGKMLLIPVSYVCLLE